MPVWLLNSNRAGHHKGQNNVQNLQHREGELLDLEEVFTEGGVRNPGPGRFLNCWVLVLSRTLSVWVEPD